MRRVLIATPSHDGAVDVEYADSLIRTIKLGAQRQIDVLHVFVPGDALICRARNYLLSIALAGKFDDVLFIDADQAWEPEQAISLLSYPVDVVGAPVRKKQDDEAYNVRAPSPGIPIDSRTGLWIVESVGTGFIRLSRRAIEALWEMSPEYTDSGRVSRMVFDLAIIDGQLWGEDTVMCAKLREAGIRVHVDPSFTVTHIGRKRYEGDFRSFVERLLRERGSAA